MVGYNKHPMVLWFELTWGNLGLQDEYPLYQSEKYRDPFRSGLPESVEELHQARPELQTY